MPTLPSFKKKVRQYVFHNDERQAEVKRSKQIENDSDGDWVLDFEMDKVINAYQTFENQNHGLDKLLEENVDFVPPLKETKVR